MHMRMNTHGNRVTRKMLGGSALALAMLAGCSSTPAEAQDAAASEPDRYPPRIETVVPLAEQPHEDDDAVIWFDDFSEDKPYAEKAGGIDDQVGFGGVGGSIEARYVKGDVPGGGGTGSRRLMFGDSVDRRNIVREGEHFREVYWRIYVKHQHGWTGNPAKMSRATTLLGENWKQGMIAHVWDGGESICINPASGIRDGKVVVNKYNDFDNLRWWRARKAEFPIHATEESGYWVPVEARAKLNTPGEANGEMELWINGKPQVKATGLDWHGDYTDHGINAVFLEAYWNRGSPVTQSRWYDNFVVSTKPIGPVYASRNAELIKRVAPGDQPGTWQVEVAADAGGERIVWRSGELEGTDRVRVNADTGRFAEAGATSLTPGETYFVRVREQVDGNWTDWSHWHQPFQTPRSE